jgi:hypothetical protein
MAERSFAPKFDWWLIALIGVVLVVPIVSILFSPDFYKAPWILLLGLVPHAIVFTLVLPLRYIMKGDHLLVQSGFIRYRIPYVEVTEVKPTHNPLSSPAMSLDRLRIQYGKKWLMIAPADKQAFVNELNRRVEASKRG